MNSDENNISIVYDETDECERLTKINPLKMISKIKMMEAISKILTDM